MHGEARGRKGRGGNEIIPLLRTSGQHQLVQAFLIHRSGSTSVSDRDRSFASPPHLLAQLDDEPSSAMPGWLLPPHRRNGGRRGWRVCDARRRRRSVLHKYLVAHLRSARARPRARTTHGKNGDGGGGGADGDERGGALGASLFDDQTIREPPLTASVRPFSRGKERGGKKHGTVSLARPRLGTTDVRVHLVPQLGSI